MREFKHYINGEFLKGSKYFESIDPSNGEPWALFPAATKEESEYAIESAHSALFKGPWSEFTATQRGKLLHRLGDLIAKNSDQLGDIETKDSGKLRAETRAQSGYVADYYYYYAGLADKIQGDVLPIDKPNMRVFTTREPIGVVVAIVPWNAQLFLSATKIAPAIAAGNTVVVKASEQAPGALFKLAELIDQAGFPPGVVNIITGHGEPCGRVLTSHPKVASIAFTGGGEVAKKIVKNSAENFAHVSLELGGKSPMLIFDDCDISAAVNGIIAGNFGASGQSCVAGSRVFVQRNIHKETIKRLVDESKNIVVGDPNDNKTHVGPLATLEQVERAKKVLDESVKQGAEVIFGGCKSKYMERGWYFDPTLVLCHNQSIECVQTELFAPVISLIVFDSEEEVIDMANDSDFGLGAGIFTQNLARAHRVSQKLRSGIVWVNTYRSISPISPFGGFKKSGGSREAGLDAIYEYTRTKTTWINTSSEPMGNPFIIR
jgi:aldehyde dehydrogenase (NAD+)